MEEIEYLLNVANNILSKGKGYTPTWHEFNLLNDAVEKVQSLSSSPGEVSEEVKELKFIEPDENGMIDVPDHLMPLYNFIGNQFGFVIHSGKNWALAAAHILQKAEHYFKAKEPSEWVRVDTVKELLNEVLSKPFEAYIGGLRYTGVHVTDVKQAFERLGIKQDIAF